MAEVSGHRGIGSPLDSKPTSLSKKIFEAYKNKGISLRNGLRVDTLLSEKQPTSDWTAYSHSPREKYEPEWSHPLSSELSMSSLRSNTILESPSQRNLSGRRRSSINEALAMFQDSLDVEDETVEVFLGGSCGTSTWRGDKAIPFLERSDITYYNPQQGNWTPEMVPIEARAKEQATVLFFVINKSTRAMAAMSEVIEFICRGRTVVLVIQDIPDGIVVEGDLITGRELKDLNRARAYLRHLAERYNVTVYRDVRTALETVVDIVYHKRMSKRQQFLAQQSDDLFEGGGPIHSGSPRRKIAISRRVSLRCLQRRTLEKKHPNTKKGSHTRLLSIPGAMPEAHLLGHQRAVNPKEHERHYRRSHSQNTQHDCARVYVLRTSLSDRPARVDKHTQQRLCSCPDKGKVGVFLGGSCNPTTWRKDVALPILNLAHIPYYNPQVDMWTPDLIEKEAQAKEEAAILLFVIDNATRAIVSMGEATEFICRGRNVVLVVQDLVEGSMIDDKRITGAQLNDLNRVRAYLKDIAFRHGIVVYTDVMRAVLSAVDLYRCLEDETTID